MDSSRFLAVTTISSTVTATWPASCCAWDDCHTAPIPAKTIDIDIDFLATLFTAILPQVPAGSGIDRWPPSAALDFLLDRISSPRRYTCGKTLIVANGASLLSLSMPMMPVLFRHLGYRRLVRLGQDLRHLLVAAPSFFL